MSLAVRIIPCLDVRGGRVVKGINFKDIVDAGDPAEAAKRYDAEGADEICMLDIDASFEERSTTIETVKSIASQVFIPCLLYTSPSPRDISGSRMPSSA